MKIDAFKQPSLLPLRILMNLTRKILIILLLTIIGSLGTTTYFEIRSQRNKFISDLIQTHKIIVTNLMNGLRAALFNVDSKRISDELQTAKIFGAITRIIILDDQRSLVNVLKRNKNGSFIETKKIDIKKLNLPDALYAKAPLHEYSSDPLAKISDFGILRNGDQRFIGSIWYEDSSPPVFVGYVIFEFSHKSIEQLTKSAIISRVIAVVILAVVLLTSIFIFLRISVLSRLTYLHNAVNGIRNRDYTAELKVDGHDELSSLSRAFKGMVLEVLTYEKGLETMVAQRTMQLQESRDKVKAILETIDQGIVSIDENFNIQPEYSKRTFEILDQDQTLPLDLKLFNKLMDLSNLSNDARERMFSSLRSAFGEDLYAWEVNAHNLPGEIILTSPRGIKYLALAWDPILSVENQTVSSFLLCIRDLTRQRALEITQKKEEASILKLKNLVRMTQKQGSDAVFRFLQSADRRLPKSAADHLSALSATTILIDLHTIKGEARTLGMADFSAQIHETESAIKANNLDQYQSYLHESKLCLQEYLEVFRQTFTKDFTAESSFLLSISKVYQSGLEYLESQSRRIDYFQLIDAVGSWDLKMLEDIVVPCLIHAMSNSIDHGYLLPEKKGLGRRSIHFRIAAYIQEDNLVLDFEDRGYGLDIAAIRKRAADMGLDVSNLRPEDIVFLPEFSTSNNVSMTSGRGVGMSAIKKIVETSGGKVYLENLDTGGSRLRITLQRV